MPNRLYADDKFTGTVPVSTGVTDKACVALCEISPASPETVSVAVAGGADFAAVRVKVLVPAATAGLKLALTPSGSPETVSFTFPSKLPLGITRTRLVLVIPCEIEAVDAAEIEKSGDPACGDGSTS